MRSSEPRLCYVTDRHGLESRSLLPVIRMAVESGVDLIQIREKDLPTRELLELVSCVLGITRGTETRLIVNDRLDVALGAGADGVHLGGESMPTARIRAALSAMTKETFWLGISCHSVGDVRAAQSAGASYALLGPIFDTPSKRIYGPPLGLAVLAEAAQNCQIPLLALGGVTPERVRACIEAGATGIAGISLFQRPDVCVEQLKNLRREIVEPAEGRGSEVR
jgi:thiamine-phosphate pyrophosphorylase